MLIAGEACSCYYFVADDSADFALVFVVVASAVVVQVYFDFVVVGDSVVDFAAAVPECSGVAVCSDRAVAAAEHAAVRACLDPVCFAAVRNGLVCHPASRRRMRQIREARTEW